MMIVPITRSILTKIPNDHMLIIQSGGRSFSIAATMYQSTCVLCLAIKNLTCTHLYKFAPTPTIRAIVSLREGLAS